MKDVAKFLEDKKELFVPKRPEHQTNSIPAFDEVVDELYDTVEDSITLIWLELRERFDESGRSHFVRIPGVRKSGRKKSSLEDW